MQGECERFDSKTQQLQRSLQHPTRRDVHSSSTESSQVWRGALVEEGAAVGHLCEFTPATSANKNHSIAVGGIPA